MYGQMPYGPANVPDQPLGEGEFAVPAIGANLARFEQNERDSEPTGRQRFWRWVVIGLVFVPLAAALIVPLWVR